MKFYKFYVLVTSQSSTGNLSGLNLVVVSVLVFCFGLPYHVIRFVNTRTTNIRNQKHCALDGPCNLL